MAAAVETYEPVIGLEVHCQLLTDSKAFSPDSAAFGARPNEHVDPISLGHPGTLPILNERVVSFTVRMGLATNCQIRRRSTFARKHYFYPDLPKGYQISQYEDPICHDGWVEIGCDDGAPRRIGITRIHMEEDAGKSLHDQDPADTLLDYNRCGVPLVEIVTEPDLRSPAEASQFLQKIRQIVRYLGICDGNMEEGSLRCDANVSVRLTGDTRLGTKTEVKNMNSFRNVERALSFEIERQMASVRRGRPIDQETLLWDATRLETRAMRSKEEAHDYRYFPDPDLVPLLITDDFLDEVRHDLPEMPEDRRRRFVYELALPEYDAGVLTEEKLVADYFEETVSLLRRDAEAHDLASVAKAVSNFVMTQVLRVLNERSVGIEDFPVEPKRLAGLVRLRLDDRIGSSAAQEIMEEMLGSSATAEAVAAVRNLTQVSDEGALRPVVRQVVDDHPRQAAQYCSGKQGLLGFFIGQVMRTYPGAPDPKLVRELLLDELGSRNGT